MKLLTSVEIVSIRPRLVSIAALLILVIAAICVAASMRRAPTVFQISNEAKTAASVARDPVPIQPDRTPVNIDGVRVTLRRTGFEPAQITRVKGPFGLLIDNVSEMGEMSFRLLRENGSIERDLIHKKDKFRLRQVVDLQPGHYVLTVVDHPDWRSEITISAR